MKRRRLMRDASASLISSLGSWEGLLYVPQVLHLLLELLAVAESTVLDTGTIVIDGVHRVMQELGYLR
jgi:hypothetical protein